MVAKLVPDTPPHPNALKLTAVTRQGDFHFRTPALTTAHTRSSIRAAAFPLFHHSVRSAERSDEFDNFLTARVARPSERCRGVLSFSDPESAFSGGRTIAR